MKIRAALLCLTIIAALTIPMHGQNYIYATGNPAFSTKLPIDHGFIDLNNGEIHLEFPLATHAQRGHIPLVESLVYDSRIWQITPTNGYTWQPTNVPNSMGGWRLVTNNTVQAPTYNSEISQTGSCGPGQPEYPTQEWFWNFAWTDPAGAPHLFGAGMIQQLPIPCQPDVQNSTTGAVALDGSGYTMSATYDPNWGGPDFVITDVNGNEVYPVAQDTDGNYYSSDSNGNLIDTLGRTPVITTTSGNQITYSVLGWNGSRNNYVITTEPVNYNTNFNQTLQGYHIHDVSGSFTAIKSIQLPDGSSYSFTYGSGTSPGYFGELGSITLPTGGVITLGWQTFTDAFQNRNRWIYGYIKDGGTTHFQPTVVSNCSGSNSCQQNLTVTDPAGNDTVYLFTLDPGTDTNANAWNTEVIAYQGTPTTGPELEAVLTNYTYATQTQTGYPSGSETFVVPQTQTVQTEIFPVGQTTLTAQTVTNLNATGALPTCIQHWDYYSGFPTANPTIQTAYSYYANTGRPSEVDVRDGSGSGACAGNLLSKTTYGYDQTTPSTVSGIPNHTNGTSFGNLTTTSQWINTSNSYLTTTMAYDTAGTLQSETDPNGTTTYSYDSTDTYVQGMTPPTPSSGVSLPSSDVADPSSGLLSSAKDPNTNQIFYKNYDAFGRVGEIDYPDGGKTVFSYTPNQSDAYSYQNSSNYGTTQEIYDSYGRVIRTAVANGQSTNPWYVQDTCYNNLGQVSFASYSYQASSLTGAEVCSGAGETFSYDALGRITKVAHSDGTQSTISYSGRATESTDEKGVSRITQTDALGRITAVCEVSSTTLPGGSGAPANCALDLPGTGYLTTYAYNLAAYTTTVSQGLVSRTFQTDSLGRPVSTTEPESGTTTYSYAYNPNPGTTGLGLWVKRQKPKANQANPNVLTATYTQYDTLGRPVNINYDDGVTATKTFSYDASAGWGVTQQNIKGRLSGAFISYTAGTVYSYDQMGRVNLLAECTPSNCGTGAFVLNYSYDWASNALTSSDGFFTDTYTYSLANETQSILSSLINSTHPQKLVYNVQNGPFGPVSWQLGNGLNGVRQYDSMGRVSGGWVCSGSVQAGCSGGTQLYGFTSGWSGASLTSSCDTSLNQCGSYTYDPLGRMSAMSISSGTPGSYTYAFDRWGNRVGQTEISGSGGPQPSYSFNSYNQITNSGIVYDATGNETYDGVHHYAYDAEGNITAVDSGSAASYVYNALNQRVRTNTSAAAQEFIFNAAGQRVSSWDPVNKWEDSGQTYWGSTPVEFYADGYAQFQHQDWQGTLRATTDYTGAVQGTYASLPFGDFYTTTGVDDDANHFAMLDFDPSDTDHAQYRQYSPTSGRWMSPDPYHGSYDFSNPQSFNRYEYVLNSPLSSVDPQGLFSLPTGGGGCGWCASAAGAAGPYAPVALAAWGISDLISHLLGHHPLQLHPTPDSTGTPTWDGNFGESLGIPTKIPLRGSGIAAILGLPDAGCEFGPCGGMGYRHAIYTHGRLPRIPSYITIYISVAAWRWAQSGHHQQAFPDIHGNWCGPGGAGLPTDNLDAACMLHDYCYDTNGLTAGDNLRKLDPSRAAALQQCNQDLCMAAIWSGDSPAARAVVNYFMLVPRSENACH